MADRGDFNDISWLYNSDDDQGAPTGKGPKRSLADLYADEDLADKLPPLVEEDESDEADVTAPGFLGLFGRRGRGQIAGADASEPTRKERRRRRHGLIDDEDDPFAKLITPLSDAEVTKLRAELSREEILLVKWKRQHRLAARWRTIGLLLSFAVLAMLSLRYGKSYVSRNLNHPDSPQKLVDKIGKEKADAITFALALLTPFLSLGLLTDFFEQTLRTFAMRSIKSLGLAIFAATAIVVVAALLVNHQPIVAAGTVVAWFVLRGLIRLVIGGRSGEL